MAAIGPHEQEIHLPWRKHNSRPVQGVPVPSILGRNIGSPALPERPLHSSGVFPLRLSSSSVKQLGCVCLHTHTLGLNNILAL